MFTAEARLGASFAASMTRICSGGTRAKLAIPHIRMATAAGSGQRISTVNASKTRISTLSETIRVRSIERSAALPPHMLPSVNPTPNSTSMAVM
ncbi:hypothetical protein D3C80_1841420 [compost metagenome]